MTLHILCAVRDAAPFIAECLDSVRAQSHGEWVMLLRDDGSRDDSAQIIARYAQDDPRIQLVQRSPTSIGAAAGYFSLLQLVPDGAAVACIDGDDVWTPEHLAASLAALRDARRESPPRNRRDTRESNNAPALVHGDLEVVDAQLRTLLPSFWHARGIIPEPTDVRRIAVNNVVTGSSIVMNAALAGIIRSHAAHGALFQDSWFALAAAAAGTIIARRDITVRYRQHGTNTVGAQPRDALTPGTLLPKAAQSLGNREQFRRDLARTAAQSGAFARAYADLLPPEDRAFLERYAALPAKPWPVRALGVLAMRAYPGRPLLSAIGEALRC